MLVRPRAWSVLAIVAALTLPTIAPLAMAAAPQSPIQLNRFSSAAAFASGTSSSTVVEGDRLRLAPGEVSGTWTSPTVSPSFAFTRLVASWNAETPADGHLRVQAQATTSGGQTSAWYVLGIWAADDTKRTSVAAQSDALARVATDTLLATGNPFTSYTLRVRLERVSPDDPSPKLALLAAQISNFSYSAAFTTSSPLSNDPVELSVPPLSQETHGRQYAQWGGGGEAWCSPTSTEMVIEYWGRGPTADDLSWVDPGFVDPSVDFAARGTYDSAYRGTGNWPFNTAYAARFGLEAFVTQLHSLAEAEQFVRAGIPIVASIAARPNELDGFLFSGGTNGHLVVIIGFDAAGKPIVNDPAAYDNASVRRVYDRAQFERVWLRGSAGTVYVIRPTDVALPQLIADTAAVW